MENIQQEVQAEKRVQEVFTVFTPHQVTDEETGEVITFKRKEVFSRAQIENSLAEAQKVVDEWQAKLDAINKS